MSCFEVYIKQFEPRKLHWSTKKIKLKVVYNFLAELGVFCTTKIKSETHFSQSGQVFFLLCFLKMPYIYK